MSEDNKKSPLYLAKVLTKGEYGMTSKGAGTYVVPLQFEDGPRKGETLSWTGNLEGAGAEYAGKHLQAMGMQGTDPETIAVGRLVKASIKEEPFNGKVTVKVGVVFSIGSGTGARPDADKIAQLKRNLARAMGVAPAAAPGDSPFAAGDSPFAANDNAAPAAGTGTDDFRF